MKKIVCILPLLFGILFGQNQWYVAAKSGLNLREKPDPQSTVIQLIPYGKKVTTKYSDDYVQYVAENFKGVWWKVEYQGKTGFLFSEFIFPVSPPDTSHFYFEDYIRSFPLACGPVTSETIGSEEGLGTMTTQRYLTKNGIYYYQTDAYEYRSFVCILPSFSIYRAFHLLRMFKNIKTALGKNDDFPLSDTEIKLNDMETFTIQLKKNDNRITRLELRWEGDGYPEQISIYETGDGVTVEVESGSI